MLRQHGMVFGESQIVQAQTCTSLFVWIVRWWALYRRYNLINFFVGRFQIELVGINWGGKHMDFGISLDPSSVVQRHSLEDSDEEEDESETVGNATETFTVPNRRDQLDPAGKLIIAIGQPAVIFIKSYLDLEPLPSYTISTKTLTAFKDKHFSSGTHHQDDTYTVSEGSDAKRTGSDVGRCLVCTHQQPLNSKYCNLWCSKVMEKWWG